VNRSIRAGAALALVLLALSPAALRAQTAPLDLSGVWAPYRGGRGDDPSLAPPPAGAIVLKAPYAERYEARRALEQEAVARGEPLATDAVFCMPYGMPRMMSVALYPMEIIQRPQQITIVTEAFSEVRRVYMNEPQLPAEEVPPGYYGHSVGRWEGETLVIDTIAIKESVPGYQGMPHSDRMRITERIRLIAPDVLHDTFTIEDPVTLERPVTYTHAYRRMPGYKMVEFVCENNREYVDENGVVRMRVREN
jgi:hypothetical protein